MVADRIDHNKQQHFSFFSLQTISWVRGDWLELPRSDITLQDKLGEGAFGETYKGVVRVDGQWRQCAVKKLRGTELVIKECICLIKSVPP